MASSTGSPARSITVAPVAGRIGAEITGSDITQPLSGPEVAVIRQALDEWRVVFFRGQPLDHGSQIAFGRQFGELTYAHPHDDAPPTAYPEIYTVDSRRFGARFGVDADKHFRKYSYTSGWHTDVTPAINPPAGSILRADVIPAYGGDTTFTNLAAAYEGLSEPFRRFIDGLRAEHRYGANWSGLPRPGRSGYDEKIARNSLVSHHPVVRVHPRTGEKVLFVNPVFTDHILDVSPAESRLILGHLFDELTRPEYQVRFRWEPGSVAFWDNQATAHLGPQDLGHLDVERVLHRVTLIGTVPVGPDGRESDLIEGTEFVSTPVFATAAS
jgi:alpha-ketoglutarate-dependent taurine dioxygenase